jgi:transcriptional antiterminator RfaH
MEHWYCIHTKPRQESVAEENLANQGFHIYLPRVRLGLRRRGRWQTLIEPLFPRYLFVCLDVALESIAPIRSTRGVSGMIAFGGELSVLPDAILEGLQANEEGGVCRLASRSPFKQGGQVTILEGPLAGLQAIFEAETGEQRAIILLEMLGRPNRVQISLHQIAPF